jgi:hypothetical protein
MAKSHVPAIEFAMNPSNFKNQNPPISLFKSSNPGKSVAALHTDSGLVGIASVITILAAVTTDNVRNYEHVNKELLMTIVKLCAQHLYH